MYADSDHSPSLHPPFDVVVIGAGVVGCAVARRFVLQGASVLVVEKSADIIDGASKGNSGLLHTGFDAPPGSLEQACIRAGRQEYLDIRQPLNLPMLATGALVVAWTPEEEQKLDAITEQALANGVDDIERLGAGQIAAAEPQLAASALAAVRVPGESVIDPWTTPYAYLLQALRNGATLLRNTEITGGHFDGEAWRLEANGRLIRARTVINCAGLYGDRVDALLLGTQSFAIKPRKGQFVVFDKAASNLIGAIVLPVPSEMTKGIVVCRTIYGNVLVGPTAEDQDSRDDASVDRNTLQRLRQKAVEMVPALASCAVTATYAGIRPATEFKDYCIAAHRSKSMITVGGIRSTGLSAALGIARYVFEQYSSLGHSHRPVAAADRAWPRLNPLAEHETRDWMQGGNGGIVCHCELVTRREIEQALTGPLAAAGLAGLKRRTRVTMGRCQGFYCSARLSELTDQYFAAPVGVGVAS